MRVFRLPDGTQVRIRRRGFFVLDDIQHPVKNLLVWGKAKRLAKGINEVLHPWWDSAVWKRIGNIETEVDGNIVVTPDVEPRYTPIQLAKQIQANVKGVGMSLYRESKNRKEELQAIDPDDPEIDLHDQYALDLKEKYAEIKAAGQAILAGSGTSLEKYQALADLTWTWPDVPSST